MLIVLLLLISLGCLGSAVVFPTFSSLKSVVQCRIDFASNYVMSQITVSLMLYGLR